MTKTKVVTALIYVFLTVASIVSVFPLLWMFISATNHTVVRGGRAAFAGQPSARKL